MVDPKDLHKVDIELQHLVGEKCKYPRFQTLFDQVDDLIDSSKPKSSSALKIPFGTRRLGQGNTYELAIWGTWQILKNDEIVYSYFGASYNDNQLLEDLKIIENQTVKRVKFIRETLNLLIEFSNHYWLRIFMDHPSGFSYEMYNISGSESGCCISWQITREKIISGGWIS